MIQRRILMKSWFESNKHFEKRCNAFFKSVEKYTFTRVNMSATWMFIEYDTDTCTEPNIKRISSILGFKNIEK